MDFYTKQFLLDVASLTIAVCGGLVSYLFFLPTTTPYILISYVVPYGAIYLGLICLRIRMDWP